VVISDHTVAGVSTQAMIWCWRGSSRWEKEMGDEKDEGLCGAPDEPIRRQRQMVGHLEEIESLPSEQQLL
jgi:hypothetical protein